jgi:transposase-like protein
MESIKFFTYFISEEKVYQYIHQLRARLIPLKCPYCHKNNVIGWGKYWRKPGLHRYFCKSCERTFNDLTGTIFERSQIALSTWLFVAFLLALGCSTLRITKEIGVHFTHVYKRVWQLRNLALFFEINNSLDGTVEADEIYVTAGSKGQNKGGGKKDLGRNPRKRGKKKGPGRGHYRKDTPCVIAWVSRAGKACIRVVKSFCYASVKAVAKSILEVGNWVYTDGASSYKILASIGFFHDSVDHSKKEYVRGDVHENRAECIFSLLKPFLATFRGVSKPLLPAYTGFFQFLFNYRHLTCFEKAELIICIGLCPAFAQKAKEGEYAKFFCEILQQNGRAGSM